ncbi:57L protein [Yaba-like disease virus]|uniref:Assembly protein G7 n=1 Tax=Yaba-like disease virus TaxID=132475 RepID=Q9DHQ6_YLDV|nr:57L protein [Yaba-like disease virus]CAC21295.1 57L protein [Yaba-like disease virus]
MIEQKQSVIFPIISKAIVKSVTGDIKFNKDYIDNKAKQLCYCNNLSYKESLINSIYTSFEHEINISDANHLIKILKNLKPQSVYVCNSSEFWKLYNSLYRFTHSKSFFSTCNVTIIATLSTLLTLILSNKLLYAAEMVEGIEEYLFNLQKPPLQDLADLLDMKYGLINLVQYKIFPLLLGNKNSYSNNDTREIFFGGFSNPPLEYNCEIEKLLELPIKTNIISDVYDYLTKQGINTFNNYAEYVAGLKIEEVNSDTQTKMEDNKPLITIQPLTKQEINSMQAIKILKEAQKYSKGHTLDGAVTSPITKNETISSYIPFSSSDMAKFTLLEYLYMMRVMANSIKKKNGNLKCQGITLNINSPFKSITIPGTYPTK